MRYFLITAIALLFGFVGAIALSYMPKELIANSQLIRESSGELVSSESTENNAVEVEGVRLEILVPERVWTIPPNQPDAETPVKIGIRITNTKQESVRFRIIAPLPTMIGADGLKLKVSGGRDRLLPSGYRDERLVCSSLLPEETLTFFLDAKLLWRDNKLYLEGADGVGGGWNYQKLYPGTYQVGLIYVSIGPLALCHDLETITPETTAEELNEGFWGGEVITPLVEVRIVEP